MFQELYRNKTWQHVGDAITANRGSQTHPGKALKRNWILQNTNTRESFIFYTTWILKIQNIGKNQARKKQWNIKRQVPDFKNFVTLQTLCKDGLSLFGTCLLFCRSSPPSYPGVRAVCLSALGTQLSRPLLYHVLLPLSLLWCNFGAIITELELTIWGKLQLKSLTTSAEYHYHRRTEIFNFACQPYLPESLVNWNKISSFIFFHPEFYTQLANTG